MATNRRLHYAVRQFAIAPDGSQTFIPIHGLQSAGSTTNFNLEQIYEIGQLQIYDTVEQIPDVEVTMEKIIDGYPLIWHLATNGAPSGTLSGRSNERCIILGSVFTDTQDSASGVPIAEVQYSGAVASNITLTIPVDGSCTESVSFVGNNKKWRYSGFAFSGAFDNTDAPIGSGGTQQRDNVVFIEPSGGTPVDENGQFIALGTFLPDDIPGIESGGVNPIQSDGSHQAHVQSITISCVLGRDQIFELGHKAPYFRYATFPVEVTTEIVVIGSSGDNIGGTEEGGENGAEPGSNLKNQSIRVYLQDGTFITTGSRNKIASVTEGGGDAGGGGGNVTYTYRYSTFNTLTIKHPADPTVALRGGAV